MGVGDERQDYVGFVNYSKYFEFVFIIQSRVIKCMKDEFYNYINFILFISFVFFGK